MLIISPKFAKIRRGFTFRKIHQDDLFHILSQSIFKTYILNCWKYTLKTNQGEIIQRGVELLKWEEITDPAPPPPYQVKLYSQYSWLKIENYIGSKITTE